MFSLNHPIMYVAKLNDVGLMNPGDEEDDIIFDDVEDEDEEDGAVGYA